MTGSDLHQEGGILFFTLALLLWPVLWVLQRSEKRIHNPVERNPENLQGSKASKNL